MEAEATPAAVKTGRDGPRTHRGEKAVGSRVRPDRGARLASGGRAGLFGCSALLVAVPLAATPQEPPLVTLRGTVVDTERGFPLRAARVVPIDSEGGALTDEAGTFALRVPAAPEVRVLVDQVGYGPEEVTLPTSDPSLFHLVELRSDPIALDGLDVVVARQALASVLDRHERRRRGYAGEVSVIPPDRFVRSAAGNAYDLVRGYLPSLFRCGRFSYDDLCLQRRGRDVRVKLCVDDMEARAGPRTLDVFDPRDLYTVELYDRGGLMLVYTRFYMLRALKRPIRVSSTPELAC